ncbi:alpha/beta hydrolase family protein [Actinophytocola sp.]|uniref:alpha/beta hydrolase family protein n=1 Tax=Actinophytocola sp. TaxID=1872138 RepID=UPI003D6B8453
MPSAEAAATRTAATKTAASRSRHVAVATWMASPGRTAVVVTASATPGGVAVARMDPDGELGPPSWLPGTDGYRAVGWADEDVAVLRRGDGRATRLALVRISDEAISHHQVIGRPVAARIRQSGGAEVLVAMIGPDGPLLCLYRPGSGSYQPLAATAGTQSMACWLPDEHIIAVNVAGPAGPAVRLVGYDDHGSTEVPVAWPAGRRPVAAVGNGEMLGLTGVDDAGESVPGTMDLRTRAVRWFTASGGYSTADVDRSGTRLLAVIWEDHGYHYRVLDHTGTETGHVEPATGLATDLCLTADGHHVIGGFQSPSQPLSIMRWELATGNPRPVASWSAPTQPAAIRWQHRQVAEMPEWTFEPAAAGHGSVVVYLHGGPHIRLNQSYEPVIAALVADGWTVLGLNYPGSAGYSAEYRDMTVGDWGGVDLDAVMSRVMALRAESPQRPICLYGSSYGAYLTLLACAGAVPVDAAAVWAPITDLVRLLESATGTRRRWLESELGELTREPGRLRERSPVHGRTTLASVPLLIGHGVHDDRCPVDQSRTLVDLLGHVPTLRYLEDAHGSHMPSDWERWAGTVVDHLRRVAL